VLVSSEALPRLTNTSSSKKTLRIGAIVLFCKCGVFHI